MSDTRIGNPEQATPKSNVALWKCAKCGSFISIESLRAVSISVCPVCQNSQLELCGTFQNFPTASTEDDSCLDYDFESDFLN